MANLADTKDVLVTICNHCKDLDSVLAEFDKDEETFNDNITFHSACIFILMQIGENVKRIDNYLIENSSEIDWRSVCRFRDLVAHNYGKVATSYVWSMIIEDYPTLKKEISRLLSEYANLSLNQ